VAGRRAAAIELRDPLLLQVFFADVLDPSDVGALFGRMRDRSNAALAAFDDAVMPAAARTQERGFSQPKAVAEFGQAFHRFIVDWCEERIGNA
jgi:hypothetical protein